MKSRTYLRRLSRWIPVAVWLAAPGCKTAQVNPAAVTLVPDPDDSGAPLAEVSDLEELRNRAAKGEVTAVRGVLGPRLDDLTLNRRDPGRDALRRLAIELALVQGDMGSARYQVGVLEADFRQLGEDAEPADAALLFMLHAELRLRDGDYEGANKMCVHALELVGEETSSIRGDVLRVYARTSLVLADTKLAMSAVEQALIDHSQILRRETLIDLHEDQLLRVEILMAQNQPIEAVIAAGDLYHGALDLFGPDTLPHAEALVLASAASLATGDAGAAHQFFLDAKQLLEDLQASQGKTEFPVSQRLLVRIQELTGAFSSQTPESEA